MSMKRVSLAATAVPAKAVPISVPPPAAASGDPRKGEPGYKSPSRKNAKAVMGYYDPAVSKLLKQIALDSDSTIQGCLTEALNDFFVKHGRDAIAQ